LLAAGALAFVLPPLLGRRRTAPAPANDATNVAVYRDQLRELEADLAAGTLARDQYDEARRELEARLLDDVRGSGTGARAAKPVVILKGGRTRQGRAAAVSPATPLRA